MPDPFDDPFDYTLKRSVFLVFLKVASYESEENNEKGCNCDGG